MTQILADAEMAKQLPWALPNLCFLTNDCNLYGVRHFLTKTGARHIEKPFSFDQIAGVINDILDDQQQREPTS